MQEDVLETQYHTLMQKVAASRDFDFVKKAHDEYLAVLLAETFRFMPPVRKENFSSKRAKRYTQREREKERKRERKRKKEKDQEKEKKK